jgi:hypothetical protein
VVLVLAVVLVPPARVVLVVAWIMLVQEGPATSFNAFISLLIDRRILRRTRRALTGNSPAVDDVLAEGKGEMLDAGGRSGVTSNSESAAPSGVSPGEAGRWVVGVPHRHE